jgi:hypothetical protein
VASVALRHGEVAGLICNQEDTSHAYDRNWTDRSRDAGGKHGDRRSSDLDDYKLSERGFSQLCEMLG